MNAEELYKMEDVTFSSISYDEFVHEHLCFLSRMEVQGVMVSLLQQNKIFSVSIACDDKIVFFRQLPYSWNKAYSTYKKQVNYVRKKFASEFRKEIFYYRDASRQVHAAVYN